MEAAVGVQSPAHTPAHTSASEDLLAITGAAVSSLSKDQEDAADYYSQGDASRVKKGMPGPYSPVKQTPAYHDESVLSRKSVLSDRSIEHSAFLHGNAQKVLVSAKKLREIKSPFDQHVQSSYDSMLKSPEMTLRDSPGRRAGVEQVELSSTFGSSGKRVSVEKHIAPPQLRPHPENNDLDDSTGFGRSHKRVYTLTGEVTDSGFATQHVQVIREVRGESAAGSQNTSSGEMPSMEEFPEDRVVTAHHREGDSQNSSCTQPEIVTVDQGLVRAVTSHSGIASHCGDDSLLRSDHSPRSTSTHRTQQSLQDRFDRFQPALLKQGSLQGSSAETSLYSASSREDVHIEKFSLTDKRRLLKDKFVKRQNGGPVKKQVQPTLVHPPVTKHVTTEKSEGVAVSNVDAVSTAAVAAASAVAATQPFLKMQLDLEYRMAQVLERLAKAEGDKQAPAVAADSETRRKLEDLELSVKDITQRRLDFLEEAQKQQINWQAQLISLSRAPQPALSFAPEAPVTQATNRRGARSPGRGRSPKARVRSRSPKSPVATDRDVSVLSTPAPRQRPPRPLEKSPTGGGQRTPPGRTAPGGFLAHILAHTESPKLASPLATSPPTRLHPHHCIDRRDASPTVKRAQHLLEELSDLREETQHALQGDLFERSYHGDQHTGPAPLDHYLKKPTDLPASTPYPARQPGPSGDAPPIVNKYVGDARDALREMQEKRHYLETNLDAILRARQESEVYAAIDTLTQGSIAERLRIRKLVDAHIDRISTTLESDVAAELLRIEEKQNFAFLVPARDSNASRAAPGSAGGTGGRSKLRAEARVDSGLRRARQLAEMRLAALGKENVPRPLPKVKGGDVLENSRYVERVYGKAALTNQRSARASLKHQPYPHFSSDQPRPRSAPVRASETLHGVSMSTAKTQTKPAPVPVATPLLQQPASSAGAMPTAIPLGVPRRTGTRPNIQLPPPTIPGQPIATSGNALSPIATMQPTVTSTPIVGQRTNVGLVTVKDAEVEREEQRQQRKHVLESKVLPSVNVDGKRASRLGVIDITPVDIDTDPSLMDDLVAPHPHATLHASPGSKVTKGQGGSSPSKKVNRDQVASSPESKANKGQGGNCPGSKVSRGQEGGLIRPALQQLVKDAQEELEQALEKSYGSDTFEDATQTDELEGSPIALPGHSRPAPAAYHGPQFPPENPTDATRAAPTRPEEELVFAQRRRDLLLNKANDWVEHELLAQIIQQVYTSKNAPQPRARDTVSQAAPLPRRHKPAASNRGYQEVVERSLQEEEGSEAGQDSLIAEALGREGLQVFVDAGVAVDDNLVNALIREVLEERVHNMVGQKTSRDDEGMPHAVRRAPGTSHTAPPTSASTEREVVITPAVRKARAPSPPVQMPDTPVPTPEPTPRGSPRASPPPQRVATPPQTPDWTPEPSRAPVLRERRESGDSDLEAEVADFALGARSEPARRSPNPEKHDVLTPDHTPPASPVGVEARTPSPSVKEDDYTPVATPREASPRAPTPARDVVSHGIQTTPPPQSPRRSPRPAPPPSTTESEEETETSSWASATETGAEQISEGQWLLSGVSEGELGLQAPLDPMWRERLRENVALTTRSNDDTFNEAADIDKDQQTHRSYSDGEFIGPTAAAAAAAAGHYPGYGAPHQAAPGTEVSLGEVPAGVIHAALLHHVTSLSVHKRNSPRRAGPTRSYRDDTHDSPGETGGAGASSSAVGTSDDDNADRPQAVPTTSGYRPSAPVRRKSSPSPPPMTSDPSSPPAPLTATRTITVRPSPTREGEEGERWTDGVDGPESPEEEEESSTDEQGPTSVDAPLRSSLQRSGGSLASSLGSGRFVAPGPVASGSPQKSAVRRFRPGSGMMSGPSPGGRPGGVSPGGRAPSPGGRAPSPEKRSFRSAADMRKSREEAMQGMMTTTLSLSESFTRTTERHDLDDLLADPKYGYLQLSGGGGLGGTRESGEPRDERPATPIDEKFTQSFFMGSTSDMSLQEGLTMTMSRDEADRLASNPADSDSDMKYSSKYADSLEGTGNGRTRDSASLLGGTRQISLTVPSGAEPEEDEDASQLSNV